MYIAYINSKGYYVSYKDKVSDKYSEQAIEAKRYKSITGAIDRLCMDLWTRTGADGNIAPFIDKQIEKHHKTVAREIKIDEVLGQETEMREKIRLVMREKGRIERVDIKGNMVEIEDAEKEAVDHILKKLDDKRKAFLKKLLIEKIEYGNGYIIEEEEGADFWEGF
jgi:hypothetical protein